MVCNLVKKVAKKGGKVYINYYLNFDNNGVIIPVEVKELPMPKALEKNASQEEIKNYNEEVDFRKWVNNKFRTQFDTLATLIEDKKE